MPRPSGNSIIASFLQIYRLLPLVFRKKAAFVLAGLLLGSILELIGIGSLIPLFAIILSEDGVASYPWLMRSLEAIGVHSEQGVITTLALGALSTVVFKNILFILIYRGQVRFSTQLYEHFARKSFIHYQSLGYSYFKEENSNRILRNIDTIPLLFGNKVVLPMLSLLSELAVVSFITTALFLYSPVAMILLAGVVLPMFLIAYRSVKRKVVSANEDLDKIAPFVRNNLFQSILGYVDMVVTGTSRSFFQSYVRDAQKIKKHHTSIQVLGSLPPKIIETAMVMSIVVVCIYGVWSLSSKAELLNLLGMMGLCATRIMPSINRIIMAMVNVRSNSFVIDYLTRVENSSAQSDEPVPENSLSGSIIVSNVELSLADKKVLNGINLEIKEGEVIGLMGESGSGKSTLLNAMLGLYAPDSGEIRVDGTPIHQNLAAWRKSISFVEQSVFLLDASIAENIAFGVPKEEIDMDWVERALEGANLKGFINTLAKGLDTNVGEMGAKLSGGQKQRIGIARALYQDPEVLFFDEATSALDNRTEMEIMATISKLKDKGFTIVMVAHRISTLNICDRIYEIEEGRVKREVGYTELMNELEAMQAEL